jgi:MFS family permease
VPNAAAIRLKLRHLPAVAVGNALEFYDFLTYAFFAVHIAHAFFPSATPGIGLLKSLATFGVGFLTRPLGGMVIGRLADRLGRKPAMMISFGLMGLSIVGLALTPSAAEIGGWAAVLAVLFRLLQGFALGGEVGPSTAFLVEAAPARWRALVVSLQSASQNAAILASSLVGLSLTRLLTPMELDQYGWRIAFLLGALVVPLGLWVRRSLPETLHMPALGINPAPPLRVLLWLGSLLLITITIQTYVMNYLTTYAITSLHMNESLAFLGQIIGAVCALLVGPLVAALSDLGHRRRPWLVYPAIARLLTTLPIFWLMVHFHNAPALLIGSAVLAGLGASSPTAVVVIEALPQAIRAGAFGIMYALMISAFGGTTQFVLQGLIDWTHNPLAPAWYLTGALVLGLIAALFFPETAPARE